VAVVWLPERPSFFLDRDPGVFSLHGSSQAAILARERASSPQFLDCLEILPAPTRSTKAKVSAMPLRGEGAGARLRSAPPSRHHRATPFLSRLPTASCGKLLGCPQISALQRNEVSRCRSWSLP
jgi:hypothetical protein